MKRTKKAPRLFRESIPARRYERKILKRIPLANEREYLEGLYRRDGQSYVREADLPKKDVAHLRRLAKAVKHNRGMLQPVKLGLLAVVAAAGLVFLTFFMNPLLASAIESGLESAFVARSELQGFAVRPFAGGVSFDALYIADRNRPMRNLFEVYDANVQLDLGQLLRGKILIQDFDAGELRFGSERASTGALPEDHPARVARDGDTGTERSTLLADAGGVVQEGADELLSLDPQEILDSELARLTTPDVVDEQIAFIRSEITRTRNEITDIQAATGEFRDTAEGLLETDIRSIDSVERLVSLSEDSEAAVDEARALLDRSASLTSDIGQSRARAEGSIRAVTEAVNNDVSGIQDRIPSASDVLRGPVASFVEPRLMALVEPYRDNIDTVLEAVTWLQEQSEGREAASGPGRRGRTITFPTVGYPGFLLERAAAGAATTSVQYQAELRSLSSNPDMVSTPPTALYEQRRDGRSALVSAVFDTRSSASTRFDLDLALEAQPIRFNIPNAPFSFSGLDGSFDLTAEARLVDTGDGELREELVALLRIVPDELRFSSEGRIAERVESVIDRAETIEIDIRSPAAEGEQAVSTNLDGPIRDEIAAFLSEQRDMIVEEVEAGVRRQLDEQRARYEDELEQLLAAYSDVQTAVDDARSLADEALEQRAALETRVAELRGEVEDRVRAEAEAARQEAERRAREQAEAAAEEAEEQVREEAGRIIDSIRSPF
jgi:uncharacterized protein (TIGR03545 family)